MCAVESGTGRGQSAEWTRVTQHSNALTSACKYRSNRADNVTAMSTNVPVVNDEFQDKSQAVFIKYFTQIK